MGARNLYPAPECPRCGKSVNSVKNTYYTDDGRICRTRQCSFCEFKWWTLQYPETNINPATTMVRIERWGKATGSKKRIQIVNV